MHAVTWNAERDTGGFEGIFDDFFSGAGGGGSFGGGHFGGGPFGGGNGGRRAQPQPDLYPKGSRVSKLSESKFPKKGSAHVWLVSDSPQGSMSVISNTSSQWLASDNCAAERVHYLTGGAWNFGVESSLLSRNM